MFKCFVFSVYVYLSIATTASVVSDDSVTATIIQQFMPNAAVYNLNNLPPVDNAGTFVIPEKTHYFVYQGYVVEASANTLLKNQNFEGARNSMRSIFCALRDWIQTPGKHSLFLVNYSDDLKDIDLSSMRVNIISSPIIYNSRSFIKYLQYKHLQKILAGQPGESDILKFAKTLLDTSGRPTGPRLLTAEELFATTEQTNTSNSSRENRTPNRLKEERITVNTSTENTKETDFSAAQKREKIQELQELIDRYQITRDTLTSITSYYAGSGLSIKEMIERAAQKNFDFSARSPSPGIRMPTTVATAKKNSSTTNNDDDLLTAAARKPSPFRTGMGGNPQKILWENPRTNEEYESVLRHPSNKAAFNKYQEFKKTLRTAGTSAVLGIRPFKSLPNTWVYDLSDRFRVLFRKNDDYSITILKGVDHYHGQQ